MLATQAKNQLTAPPPPIQLSPAADATHWQWVHVPTWAWLPAGAWTPLRATASVPGVTVTATAAPIELDINYQDGGVWHSTVCKSPGTVYSDALATQINPARALNAASPDCGWTYQNSSAGYPSELVPINVRILYHATWTATGAAGGGDLGTVSSPTNSLSVKVAEVQAIVVK